MQRKNIRECVYTILNKAENDTLNNAFAQVYANNEFSPQEKAYSTNLVYQIFRNKLGLEALIRLYSHKDDLEKSAFNIMLIALCEMYYMTSIPVHASIDEAVKLAKIYAKKDVPLVNAVLRKIDKTFPDKELDDKLYSKELKFLYPKKSPLEIESTKASLPYFVLDTLRKQYGKDFAISYLNTLNETPWYSYRFNAMNKESLEARALFLQQASLIKEITPYGLSSPYKNTHVDELHAKGILSTQGASSQILTQILKDFVKEKKTIWDACCGVGGKSIPLLEQNINISYASDLNAKRLEVYKKELQRLGLENQAPEIDCISLQDAQFKNVDCIIIDAPCSGLGTLNANPDLRYKITKKSLAENSILQRELLESAYTKLASNGMICYITCSLNKNENENLIEAFMQDKDLKCLHNDYIMPSVCGADSLYLAVLEKNN